MQLNTNKTLTKDPMVTMTNQKNNDWIGKTNIYMTNCNLRTELKT
jgi:hypothetical protein